jgi:hypothetical protein
MMGGEGGGRGEDANTGKNWRSIHRAQRSSKFLGRGSEEKDIYCVCVASEADYKEQ